MGSTGDPRRKPSPARCGPVTSLRKLGGERKGVPATQAGRHLPALSDLCHAQYRISAS